MTDPPAGALPAGARLAWWGTSWLRGHVVTDLMLDAVIGEDATHTVAEADPAVPAQTLVAGLGLLRSAGATGLGLALPVEGDPLGLGGPRSFNDAALEAGQAVLVVDAGLGLVPARLGSVVTWSLRPALRRQLPDVGEADRDLRATLLTTAETLARLDVARWRPEVADRLMNLRRRAPVVAPPDVPPRCAELAARGVQALEIAELALEDDGGAVSAHEAQARAEALRPLGRAGRRALVAACSPEVWPPG